ncbi:septation protein SepH [Actinomadura spongiicola]|uniref:septation protein SepH n=1 Tax=Actinomadura spongiicola TaxID=2303421 RepID=UPI001EEE2C63|nr:septation protein SepH [Actinomadura spongiicola]
MQELRLVAVSEDGTYLVLATAGRGTRFTLPVDDRLRAAVRGHFSRLGQFEIEVESPLRPKEIQARIRSGETAEEIAESAGIPVERVRWFEGPVLQEREYMAQQAQRVAVRRPGESTPGPPLGETVEERLGRGGVDLEEVEWDSWKCEDNTWRVRLSFFDNGRPHAAEWTFDPRRRHVSPLDEIAARLTAVEWDDEPLSDTVTPLVPRRPAMKVVSSDRDLPPRELPPRDQPRDLAPRGLPTEPDQPEPVERLGRREQHDRPAVREPLRAAEPHASVVEHGPGNDPRGPFRRPGDAVALREAAAQPREAGDRPEPAAGPPAPLRPTAAPTATEPSEEPAPADETELTEKTESTEETRSAEETRPAETPEPAAEAPATVESREPGRPPEQEDEGDAAEKDAALAGEPEAATDRPEDTTGDETGDVDGTATDEAADEAPVEAPDEAPVEAPVEASDEKASGEAPAPPRETEPAAPPEPPEAEGDEAASDTPPAPQRAPQRPSPRPPAKKKQTGRPAMPAAAAQDKPAAGASPAAAGGEPAAARPARRRKSKAKRASVPSWDEIMFGARRPE